MSTKPIDPRILEAMHTLYRAAGAPRGITNKGGAELLERTQAHASTILRRMLSLGCLTLTGCGGAAAKVYHATLVPPPPLRVYQRPAPTRDDREVAKVREQFAAFPPWLVRITPVDLPDRGVLVARD